MQKEWLLYVVFDQFSRHCWTTKKGQLIQIDPKKHAVLWLICKVRKT